MFLNVKIWSTHPRLSWSPPVPESVWYQLLHHLPIRILQTLDGMDRNVMPHQCLQLCRCPFWGRVVWWFYTQHLFLHLQLPILLCQLLSQQRPFYHSLHSFWATCSWFYEFLVPVSGAKVTWCWGYWPLTVFFPNFLQSTRCQPLFVTLCSVVSHHQIVVTVDICTMIKLWHLGETSCTNICWLRCGQSG